MDKNLARSAQEYIEGTSPKCLLLYQNYNSIEKEYRISKYGNYVKNLGENIYFGPNDDMGVIISLTIDEWEEEKSHR